MQRHELAEIGHQIGNAVNHGAGGPVLFFYPVDRQPHRQRLRVGHLIAGHQPGAKRAESVAALALGPLARPLKLERPFRHVMADGIARHMFHRPLRRDIFGRRPDDERQFHLPVGLLRAARDQHVIIRPDDGRGGFHEDHRFGRHRRPAFGGVIGIVQPDADEFAGARDARPQPCPHRDQRQAHRINPAQHRQPGVRQHRPANIGHQPGQIADAAIGSQNPRALCPHRPVPQQFHAFPFLRCWTSRRRSHGRRRWNRSPHPRRDRRQARLFRPACRDARSAGARRTRPWRQHNRR